MNTIDNNMKKSKAKQKCTIVGQLIFVEQSETSNLGSR